MQIITQYREMMEASSLLVITNATTNERTTRKDQKSTFQKEEVNDNKIISEHPIELEQKSNHSIRQNSIEKETGSSRHRQQQHIKSDKDKIIVGDKDHISTTLSISKKNMGVTEESSSNVNNNMKTKKRSDKTTTANIRRPSRSKAAIAAKKKQKELEEKAQEQMLRELTCPHNLTKKEKSLLQRAFSLGITKIIPYNKRNNKNSHKMTSSSKTTDSSQKRNNTDRSSSSRLNHTVHDISPSANDLQWHFSVPEKETIEEHLFYRHLLS